MFSFSGINTEGFGCFLIICSTEEVRAVHLMDPPALGSAPLSYLNDTKTHTE